MQLASLSWFFGDFTATSAKIRLGGYRLGGLRTGACSICRVYTVRRLWVRQRVLVVRRNAARLLPTVPTVLLPHVRRRRLTNPAPRPTSPVSPAPGFSPRLQSSQTLRFSRSSSCSWTSKSRCTHTRHTGVVQPRLWVTHNRRPHRGRGYVKSRRGKRVFKLHWTSTNTTILDNYCDVLLPGNMAQKWTKVTPVLRYHELGATQ